MRMILLQQKTWVLRWSFSYWVFIMSQSPLIMPEEMLGATEESILILEVTGKDPLELFYVEDRDGFFKPATQGYSDAEIRGALVSVQ